MLRIARGTLKQGKPAMMTDWEEVASKAAEDEGRGK